MVATWSKHEVEVTFTVRFTQKSDGGLLKFEDTVEGSVPGYVLKYGNRGAYFTGPKDVQSTLNDLFENLPAAEKAAIAKIIAAAQKKKKSS